MENINKAFEDAMEKICVRCYANGHCTATHTKCAEWEVLSAIRDELIEDEKFIVECDKLVQEIMERENEQSDIQVEK